MKTIIQKALFGAALSIVSGSAMAAASSDQLVSPESSMTVAGDSNFVTLHEGSKHAARLRMTGPDGLHIERDFAAGEPIVFESVKGSAALQDGSYNFEIVWQGNADKALQIEPQSGSFRIENGVVPDNALAEGKLQKSSLGLKAQVIATDLVVRGSGCFGFDCTNGESFGFDTLRLKENNLRIKFDDTSASASFPNTDWQLTANETNNGGANQFSIDDTTNNKSPFVIEANSQNNSLYVDNGGRIGFGTNTPVVQAHIVDGNTPTVRLDQNGSDGFASQTWDVAGNETNFFIRDASNGSKLPFRIRPAAPTNSLYIDPTGKIGMGTASPGAPMHLSQAAGGNADAIKLSNNGGSQLAFENTSTGNEWRLSNNASDFRISLAGSGGPEFTLDDSGNLVITGTITANGSTFPDYVFEDGYPLLSLAEVKAHIDAHGHLPNVPSADEIERNGLDMTAMQKKLMEKVEELTLYTIEQQARIEQLEARLASKQ